MLSRRRLIAAAPLALLSGCATRFYDGQSTAPRLQMQNPGLRPPEGALNLDAGLLMPGDIILSAAKGATSLGIRMLTLSAVSHASLYVGDSQVAEAVGEGIRRRAMEQFLDEESTVAAFRHPGVRPWKKCRPSWRRPSARNTTSWACCCRRPSPSNAGFASCRSCLR